MPFRLFKLFQLYQPLHASLASRLFQVSLAFQVYRLFQAYRACQAYHAFQACRVCQPFRDSFYLYRRLFCLLVVSLQEAPWGELATFLRSWSCYEVRAPQPRAPSFSLQLSFPWACG